MAQSFNPNFKKQRTNDPQIITTGYIKKSGQGTELITFNINLALFQLVCIVNIPGEGEEKAPVYVKFKARRPKLVPVEYDNRRDEENFVDDDDQG